MKILSLVLWSFFLISVFNSCSQTESQKLIGTDDDSCTIRIACKDKPVLENALKIVAYGETYSDSIFNRFLEKEGFKDQELDSAAEATLKTKFYGMEKRFAERYVCEFDKSPARINMHENPTDPVDNEYVGEVSFSKGEFYTLCALAITRQIEGVRAYLSKYKYNQADMDVQLKHHKRYSVILVGTEFSGDSAIDKLIPRTPRGSFLLSVQNYGQPCKPNCGGALLLHKGTGDCE